MREISAALNVIEPGTLLFLTSIRRLRVSGAGVTGSVIERTTRRRTASSRHVTLSTRRGGPGEVRGRRGEVRGRPGEEWIVWHRPTEGLGHPAHRVEIAFRAETVPAGPCPPGPCAASAVSSGPARPR